MSSWFAVQAKVRQEQIAVENLKRQGFDAFVPMVRNAKLRNGRWQSPKEAFFPGYLFTHLDLQAQDVSPIRSTRGVVGLVRLGGQLIPVAAELVAELQLHHKDDAVDFAALFNTGDAVTFVDGPFEGLNGIFQARSGLERAAILLDLIGQENRVSASMHQIAPHQLTQP